MRTRNHLETIADDLRDPEFAQEYLQLGWEDGLPTFLVSLRDVITATIGIATLAEKTGLGRESLYKALSETGNPHLATIQKILSTLGYEMRVFAKQPRKTRLAVRYLQPGVRRVRRKDGGVSVSRWAKPVSDAGRLRQGR